MPLRYLNRCLQKVPGFDAGVSWLVKMAPGFVVTLSMILRGMALLHPSPTYAAYPNTYRLFGYSDWTTESITGATELFGGALLLLCGVLSRSFANPNASGLVLRWMQFGFFLAMFYSAGMGAMLFFGDWLNPSWTWFVIRAMLAGLVVLQMCSEIDHVRGKERRGLPERRDREKQPCRDALRDLPDSEFQRLYREHRGGQTT